MLRRLQPSSRWTCARDRHARPWLQRGSRLYAAPGASLWVSTASKETFTTALESGVSTFCFPERQAAEEWRQLARMRALLVDHGRLVDADTGEQVGQVLHLAGASDVAAAADLCNTLGFVAVKPSDWTIIPAEGLVAAYQDSAAKLLMFVSSSAEAVSVLEALETGVHGVILETDSPQEVRALVHYLSDRAAGSLKVQYSVATVVRVVAVGPGDRVCVDLCSVMGPGEGMLVGSFARALFLVHSESLDSAYIASRPFRVNAGAVHSYVAAPEGRTAYLSEMASGAPALIATASGATRRAVVGRAKVEKRSLVLVEAETEDGLRHSVLLQNAETVRLCGPPAAGASNPVQQQGGAAWQAHAVSQLA